MARPYDTTGKDLIEHDPASWLRIAGLASNAPVRVIDADLATVAAEADKLIVVEAPDPWIAHLELVSWAHADFGRRAARYNLMADVRHGLPVRTVAILLRPEAGGAHTTGLAQRRYGQVYPRMGTLLLCYFQFRYFQPVVYHIPGCTPEKCSFPVGYEYGIAGFVPHNPQGMPRLVFV
jgi:hypothetical protein